MKHFHPSRPLSLAAFAFALAALAPDSHARPPVRRTAPPAAHAPERFLVTVGAFHARDTSRGPAVTELSRQTVLEHLATRDGITVVEESVPATRFNAMLRQNHARGFHLDGSVRVQQTAPDAVRIECSVLVMNAPGREFRFESSTALSASGLAAGAPPDVRNPQEDALIRRAVETATSRAVAQLPTVR